MDLKILFWVAVVYLFTLGSTFATPVRHTILQSDTSDSMQTQRTCFGLYETKNALYCIPFGKLNNEDGEINLNLYLKADEESVDTVYKLSEKEIDENLLSKIFTKQNFGNASGLIQVSASYFNSILTYTPYHFSGAYKISNPSLPQLSFSAHSQNVLRFTQNFILGSLFSKKWEALFAGSVFYYKRKFYEADFDVLSAVGKKTDQLIAKSKDSSVDADAALFLMANKPILPSVGVKVFNAFNRYDCDICREREVDTEVDVATRFSLHLSSFLRHGYGKSLIATQIFYEGFHLAPNLDLVSVSYTYKLSRLNSYISFSPAQYSFGFLFKSDGYRVGVQYTNEKQANEISIERRKRTYVFGSLVL